MLKNKEAPSESFSLNSEIEKMRGPGLCKVITKGSVNFVILNIVAIELPISNMSSFREEA